VRAALREGDVEALGQVLFNRLQEPASRLEPRLTWWYDQVRSLAPAGCLMSGSGSSLFALCRNQAEADRIERETLVATAGVAERDRPSVARFRSCV
jgi:4-diphosphocytidyl-2-C-methyl-D-erythritol kinase